MQSYDVAVTALRGVPDLISVTFSAMIITALVLALPTGAHAQTGFTLGPFIGFLPSHGGKVASTGLETTIVGGPVGLRLSGFGAINQDPSSSLTVGEPRLGGDADLMLLFNLASRGSGYGLAPYVFGGRSLTVHDDAYDDAGFTYYKSRFVSGWSYGGGIVIPLGSAAELMGEVRARPTGFFDPTAQYQAEHTEYRVGLSLRLDNFFGGRRGVRRPNDSRSRSSNRPSDDPMRVILGGIADAAGTGAAASSAARVVPTAEHYLGTPYRYGGTSPITGFDCSGFVQYVFARNAVKLPRTSRQQAKVGVAMPRDFKSLAAGDLVMFASRGEPISHVAIYAGHSRIIHASSSGGAVRYDDLGTARGKWFVDHMVAARRVTPNARGLMLDLVKLLDAKSLADTALDLGDWAPRP